MAICLIDGFDHYASAVTGDGSVSNVWTVTDTSGITFVPGILDGTGRAINYAKYNANVARRSIGGSSTTALLAFRFECPVSFTHGGLSYSNILCLFGNGAGDQGWVEINSIGALQYKVGASANVFSGTVIGTSSINLAANRVYFIEVKVKVDGSTGTVDIYIDGINALSLTAQNTKSQTAATITVVGIGASSVNGDVWAFDDLYVLGDSADTRIGDRRVIALMPTADTATAAWTFSTGATGWNLINDDLADATSYIEADSASLYSLYGLADLAYTPESIDAISIVLCAKKVDAGTVTVRTKQVSGATTTNGAAQNLSSDFVHTSEIFVLNPATSAAWTPADINALQVGIERTV